MEDQTKASLSQKVWLKRISKEEKAHKKFRKRAKVVEDIFRTKLDEDLLYVPLYWSVVGVEHVGVYSNQPVPDVRPRNETQNPTYKAVARLIQRGLNFVVDDPTFDGSMHRAVDDYLSVALGWCRVKVDSVINTTHSSIPIMGSDPMGRPMVVGQRPVTEETVGDQTIRWEYTPYSRIGWEPGNSWKHVSWLYIRHRMTQLQIKERFGRTVSASKDPDDGQNIDNWKQKTFDIYEIWDKRNKRVLFIAKGEKEPLEVKDDPLGLIGFFPGPEPMMLNLPSDELIPQPDYDYIEHYDIELNRLQQRRMSLLEQLKASGAYDPGLPELGDMFENDDGEYKPVPNMMQRLNAAGGSDNVIYHLPLGEKAQVLAELTNQIQFVKSNVDEILGISDIVRGVTTASESATAQEIKGRWVGVRLTRKRECVQYTVRQMMRISAQLLASHITPENLSRMTQMQITQEMQQILSDDMMMEFIIDIETDSTIAKDEFKERSTHQEMLNGVAQFSQAVMPMVQQNALPATVASAILKASMAPYAKYDRNLEEALNQLPETQQQLQGLTQQLQEAQGQLQQVQGEAQQWQQVAQQLQMEATEAKSVKDQADAKLKNAQAENTKAKTREIMGATKDGALQPVKTAAEINELRERAESYSDRNMN